MNTDKRLKKAIKLLKRANDHIGETSIMDGPSALPFAKVAYLRVVQAIMETKNLKKLLQ